MKNLKSSTKLAAIIASAVMALIIAVMLIFVNYQKNENSKKLEAVADKYAVELNKENIEDERRRVNDSFYQKLKDGYDVNILIIGDGIGAGKGTKTPGKEWFYLLQESLQEKYKVKVNLENVSMEGNTSYAGYVRTMLLDYEQFNHKSEHPEDRKYKYDYTQYDLAIICFGQNDYDYGFTVNYESIIRAVMSKYPNCSIISVLEASQREYNQKMKDIQQLCKHYNIPIADTIASFGKNYSKLTDGEIYPNDAGQKMYFKTIKDVIEREIKNDTGKLDKKPALNSRAQRYNKLKWYSVENGKFKRISKTSFLAEISDAGVLGMDYCFNEDTKDVKVIVDGKYYDAPALFYKYTDAERHIMIVESNSLIENKIRINFVTKEQADKFKGIFISSK